ncbi:MAG: dihydroneopterin aldolase [Acetobacteraceae bacterium]|nr:dihydroneopterin aldolase [Acetobacteraceae bacterium]
MTDRRIADASRGMRHVFVRDLVLQAVIGAHAHEGHVRQPVRINVDLGVDDDGASPRSRAAVGRDELSRVVDYGKIAAAVREIVAERHVRLVETLAERIAEAALADPRVRLVRVRVEKLAALADAGSVGVEIERRRGAG